MNVIINSFGYELKISEKEAFQEYKAIKNKLEIAISPEENQEYTEKMTMLKAIKQNIKRGKISEDGISSFNFDDAISEEQGKKSSEWRSLLNLSKINDIENFIGEKNIDLDKILSDVLKYTGSKGFKI